MRPGIGLPANVTMGEAERLAAEAESAGIAKIVEAHVLDRLAATTLDDLAGGIARSRAHAEQLGLSVPWYGMDHAAQVVLFRDVLRALERM